MRLLTAELPANSLMRISGSLKVCAQVEWRTTAAGYMYCQVASIIFPTEINVFHFSQPDVR